MTLLRLLICCLFHPKERNWLDLRERVILMGWRCKRDGREHGAPPPPGRNFVTIWRERKPEPEWAFHEESWPS